MLICLTETKVDNVTSKNQDDCVKEEVNIDKIIMPRNMLIRGKSGKKERNTEKHNEEKVKPNKNKRITI